MRSRSYIAVPPGATIREQLKDRGMSQKEFAARMDLSEKHVSKLINGDVQLTPEVAVRLETVIGIPAKFWNDLEAVYREKLIKAEMENAMDEDVELARLFPYNEMSGYGWIPEARNAKEKAINLRRYFGVVKLSLLSNPQITRITCRKLDITNKADLSLMAWAQEARIQARDIKTPAINLQGLGDLIPHIRQMTVMEPDFFCPDIKKALSELGVALVFLQHLKGSHPKGITLADGNKIVVGLTAGEKDTDTFWFSLFHELAHIVLGHVWNDGTTADHDENVADAWSEDILIPPEEFAVFRSSADFSEKRVLDFAKAQGIAPGIVVGRMQRERLIRYNSMLNRLKTKYEIAV